MCFIFGVKKVEEAAGNAFCDPTMLSEQFGLRLMQVNAMGWSICILLVIDISISVDTL